MKKRENDLSCLSQNQNSANTADCGLCAVSAKKVLGGIRALRTS